MNFKAKKNPRKTRWTKAYRKTHGKELVSDPVYEFEKSRDTPMKYNRNIWTDTVQAMDKLSILRKKREDRFFERRMKRAQHDKNEIIKSNLMKHEQLISNPKIREKVDKIREEKEEEKREKKKNLNLNIGLNGESVMIQEEEGKRQNKIKKVISSKKEMKLKAKERLAVYRKKMKK